MRPGCSLSYNLAWRSAETIGRSQRSRIFSTLLERLHLGEFVSTDAAISLDIGVEDPLAIIE